MATKKVRAAALDILEKVEKEQSYSNLLINKVLEKYNFSSLDSGLLTELTYGTLQRKMTLDYYIQPFIKKQKKLDSWVRNLLRMSVFQMIYLNKIPERAIIHEAVEIAKKRGHSGISGFVNGVLRSMQREGFPSLDEIKDPVKRVSIATSHPLWLVKRWTEQFGLERTEAMCEENLTISHQTARVNGWLVSTEEAADALGEEGFHIEKSHSIPIAIKSEKGNLVTSLAFNYGLITIQDESSMIVGYALDPQPGEKILDACAAPGGKTTHIGERMKNTGEIIALDLHKHKLKLIEENAARLKLTNIHTVQMDSREADQHFSEESFNRILVDAPCSGLGVVKRKPDIKYQKTAEDIQKLATIQLELLNKTAGLVKKGGVLVYSTCTVDREENVETAQNFLKLHPEFSGDLELVNRVPEAVKPFVDGYRLELLPQDLHSDGFFIACFKKKV